MTKADLVIAHNEGYNRGYAKANAELENKIADIKANCDLAIEGRDIKIKELELELTVEKDLHQEETNLHFHAEEYIKSLEQQIEKMKMCCNCRKWRESGEQLDHISYSCHQHDFDDVCPIWELWERR